MLVDGGINAYNIKTCRANSADGGGNFDFLTWDF